MSFADLKETDIITSQKIYPEYGGSKVLASSLSSLLLKRLSVNKIAMINCERSVMANMAKDRSLKKKIK